MNAIKVLPVALVGMIAVVGCDRSDKTVTVDHGPNGTTTTTTTAHDGVGQTTITGANVGLNNQSAIAKIVGSRCAREQACNNVGVDKHYTNGLACTQKVSADMKDDLSVKDCPYGIDAKELNECLDAIQEQCNNPIDSLSRIAACRTSDLCLKTAAPNH